MHIEISYIYIKYINSTFRNFKYSFLFKYETNTLEFICKISTAGDAQSFRASLG